MNTYADVSVVIPCFRSAGTIERAVASVFAQGTKPREVIVVDDCSQDGTLALLDDLRLRYEANWLKILSLPKNVGPGSARNRGWDLASSSFVAFLDSDDAWFPNKIAAQLSWMLANPEVALSGHACVVGFGGSMPPNSPIEFRRISKNRLLLSNPFSTPTVMLKRDIPQRFVEGKTRSEDYLLWCEIILSGLPCGYSDAPMARLFKNRYGESGLSGDLFEMEKGELDTYTQLVSRGYLGSFTGFCLRLWSMVKFTKRYVEKKVFN